MPLIDLRPRLLTMAKAKQKTAGLFRVEYVKAKGQTVGATVVGPGTTSGIKINIDHPATTQVIDNVPLATTMKTTNCYRYRLG